ncbi:MAG: UDP-N-acetylmuramoyl-tripeptide--D-alanyl-D-alanine ligase [Actinomycetota bacterium]|nr:UDP-N-acetylmuramoyl-tripeptide--D-alanyl-D-alanine ligase [Actinomycetota bacterium]
MIPLTLAEVATATGGRLSDVPDPETRVEGAVEVDSRRVAVGGLFVAIPGERVDGHDFAAAAVEAGAVAALTERGVPGVPCVVVPDAVAALGRLASAVLERSSAAVVGVTGSSGKTTTKDLLAAVLAAAGETVAPAGSFNNEVGLPLTVLRTTPTTRFLVLEYSARGVGHIATLTRIAPPRYAAVLNVGTSHLGEFGSREAIARAKGELVEALPADGVAVLNADDLAVAAMRDRTRARVVHTGESAGTDVRAEGVDIDATGRASYELVVGERVRGGAGRARVALQLVGEHQVANSLSAAALALEAGLDLPAVAQGLSAARPASRWRMEVTERPDGVTVVNDAYNANPDSVKAALKALVTMARGRRSWAVLGTMAELGDDSGDEHDKIGRLAVRLDVDRLVVVGPEAARMHAGAVLEGSWGDESMHVPDVDAAVSLLRQQLAPGDVVLVKASRSARLERVAEALLAPGDGPGPGDAPEAGA